MKWVGFHETQGEGIRCRICGHACLLQPGQTGLCGTHTRIDDRIELVSYGRVLVISVEPIEKKPLRHIHPGTRVFTIGTPGCTLTCRFCTNHQLSQVASAANFSAVPYHDPVYLAEQAAASGAQGIAFSYTEAAAAYEYALDVMTEARRHGLFTIWHTNAFLTPQSTDRVAELLDAACVDLKLPDEDRYRQFTGGSLEVVLESCQKLRRYGVWLEFSTPILSGLNNSTEDIASMAVTIIKLFGPETPWHLTRGVPAWKMPHLRIPSQAEMSEAANIARTAGLQFVHLSL